MADPLKTPLNLSPCTIGDLSLDLLLQEEEELENTVTQFPVENGSPASDHVINRPGGLTITGFVTNAPIRTHQGTIDTKARVTVKGDQLQGTDINFTDLAREYLLKIRKDRTPVSVTTKRGTWENMIVTRFTRTKNKSTGDAMVFTISFIEFRQVKLVYVAASRKRTGSQRSQPRAQTGKKSTPKQPKEYASIAYELKEGIAKTFFSKAPK